MIKRSLVFAALSAPVWTVSIAYTSAVQPEVATRLSLGAFSGGSTEAATLRTFDAVSGWPAMAAVGWTAAMAVGCFGGTIRRSLSRPVTKTIAAAVLMFAAAGVGGCSPYDTPEYQEVDTAETAFLIPLEGEGVDQAKFQSEKYLIERKVAAKRVQIVHRWNQTGRVYGDGAWIPTVRLVKVNRSPITREWSAEKHTGTSNKNEAIWVESSDSVGFSMGFTVTGYIKEEDAAKFLYWYPTGSLDKVMDTEVRARVQRSVAEVAAKYPLDDLRARKQEMTDSARNDVTSFFVDRGITITTVSSFGGMTYENPKIQESIDAVFIAQQQKNVNLAAFDAQKKANERVELEAEATAEKARRIAKGEADAKVIAATGEADSLSKISEAIKSAGPAVFQLRSIEIERDRVNRWDGRYPQYMVQTGAGQGPTMLMNMPAMPAPK